MPSNYQGPWSCWFQADIFLEEADGCKDSVYRISIEGNDCFQQRLHSWPYSFFLQEYKDIIFSGEAMFPNWSFSTVIQNLKFELDSLDSIYSLWRNKDEVRLFMQHCPKNDYSAPDLHMKWSNACSVTCHISVCKSKQQYKCQIWFWCLTRPNYPIKKSSMLISGIIAKLLLEPDNT